MAQLNTEKNRIGGRRVATSRSKKDDPSSIPFDSTFVSETANEAALDTALGTGGYSADQLSVMNLNDKVFAYRQLKATNATLI